MVGDDRTKRGYAATMFDVRSRLDRLAHRHAWIGFPLAVFEKFGEDRAGALAAQLAYYAIFSIFPLLLVLSTLLGFVLHAEPSWQHAVERSAIAQLPLVTSRDEPTPLHGSAFLLVIGLVLALWSGLAVVRAGQSAFDAVYDVDPRHRPGFASDIKRAFGTLLIGGVGLIGTTLLSAAVTSAHSIAGFQVGIALRIAGSIVAVVLDTAVLLVVFRRLTVREVPWRADLPGAVLASVVLQGLQLGATAIIDHRLTHATSTYGRNIGSVIVMLSWFALQAQVLLLAAEVNVVRLDGLWDRPSHDVRPYPVENVVDLAQRERK